MRAGAKSGATGKDYLLCTMGRDERQIAQQMAVDASSAVEMILTEGLSKAMTRFNRRAPGTSEDSEESFAVAGERAGNQRTHGRASVRFDFYLPAGHAGGGNRQGDCDARARSRREGREDREDRDKWGRKRMAYRVAKLREGFYVYMVVRSSHGEVVKELERRLKVADAVIKYLTVRLDEELKRQEKLQETPRTPRRSPPAQDRCGSGAPSPSSGEQTAGNNLVREKSNGRRKRTPAASTAARALRSRRAGRTRWTRAPARAARRSGEARQAQLRAQEEGLPVLRR